MKLYIISAIQIIDHETAIIWLWIIFYLLNMSVTDGL